MCKFQRDLWGIDSKASYPLCLLKLKQCNFHSFHLLRGLECCSVTSIKGGVWWMTRCESTLEGASSMMLSFAFRILSHLIFWLDLFFFWFLLIVVYVVNWQFYALFFCIIFHVLLCMSLSPYYLCTYLNVQHLCDKIKSKPWLFMLQTMMPISVV